MHIVKSILNVQNGGEVKEIIGLYLMSFKSSMGKIKITHKTTFVEKKVRDGFGQ